MQHETAGVENAGLENVAPTAWVENAGVDNVGANRRGRICRSGKWGTKLQGMKNAEESNMDSKTSEGERVKQTVVQY